jgi:uncharacterized membrane protein
MRPDRFLTADQQQTVVDAVRLAEKDTSGEIRIHIDSRCTGNPVERAEEVFCKLGMHRTERRNGVLIYLACNSKVFAIIGDKGVNDIVPDGFWSDVLEKMRGFFRQGMFTEGLSAAAAMIGEKLQVFFPIQADDVNEQPDEISFGREERE